MPGLDPGIHRAACTMDPRVKPGDDSPGGTWAPLRGPHLPSVTSHTAVHSSGSATGRHPAVMPGLDPGIHLATSAMDPWVKPGDDSPGGTWAPLRGPHSPSAASHTAVRLSGSATRHHPAVMPGLDPGIHLATSTMDCSGFAFGKDPGVKPGNDSGVGGRLNSIPKSGPLRHLQPQAVTKLSPC